MTPARAIAAARQVLRPAVVTRAPGPVRAEFTYTAPCPAGHPDATWTDRVVAGSIDALGSEWVETDVECGECEATG